MKIKQITDWLPELGWHAIKMRLHFLTLHSGTKPLDFSKQTSGSKFLDLDCKY